MGKIIQTIILCLIVQMTLTSIAKAEVISGDSLVGNVVGDLTDGLQSTITQLETSATVTSFNVRSDLLVILENVKIMGDELVGKTFNELSSAQKQFFEKTNVLVAETREGVSLTVDKVDGVMASMGEALSRIPGVDGRPFVTKYKPSYFLKGNENYPILVSGSLVGNGSPTLKFGNIDCQIKTKTERLLEFDCPSHIITNDKNWISGELTVTKEKPWYDFFSKDKKYTYVLSVRTIDKNIGEYSLDFYIKENAEVRKSRGQSNSHRNGHCQGDRAMAWTYNPQGGCKIDMNSVNISHSNSSQSSYGGVHNLTQNGFQVRGTVRNNGTCAPRIFGQRAFVDGRGSLNVTANWVDVCTEGKEVQQETKTGMLTWAKQEKFQMPNNTLRFVLTIQQVNGEQIIVKGSEVHKWFKVDFDPQGNIAIFRPKELDLAFK